MGETKMVKCNGCGQTIEGAILNVRLSVSQEGRNTTIYMPVCDSSCAETLDLREALEEAIDDI